MERNQQISEMSKFIKTSYFRFDLKQNQPKEFFFVNFQRKKNEEKKLQN